MANSVLGFVLLFAAAASGGFYTTPMGETKDGIVTKTGWSFEAFWFLYVSLASIVLPWTVALLTVPDLLGVIREVDEIHVLLAAFFGFLWGIGCQTFGIAISMVGNSLGFALILGLSASLGSAIPLVVLHPDEVASRAGILNFTGLGLAVVALSVTAYAGILKDRDARESEQARTLMPDARTEGSNFMKGLAFCITSGCFSACLNLATNFGKELADVAVDKGAAKSMSINAIYAVSIASGSIPCLLFCGYTMVKQGTNPFAYSRSSWVQSVLRALSMAVLWLGSNVTYGVATVELAGDLGAVIGWPIYIIGMVIFANVSGIISGEWKKAGRTAQLWMGLGLVILCLAVGAVGLAGY